MTIKGTLKGLCTARRPMVTCQEAVGALIASTGLTADEAAMMVATLAVRVDEGTWALATNLEKAYAQRVGILSPKGRPCLRVSF